MSRREQTLPCTAKATVAANLPIYLCNQSKQPRNQYYHGAVLLLPAYFLPVSFKSNYAPWIIAAVIDVCQSPISDPLKDIKDML